MMYLTCGCSATFALLFAFLSPIAHCLIYNSTALIVAADASLAAEAFYLLNGYGIGYEILQVPSSGTNLPPLESLAGGNYGLIVIVSEVQYNSISALTTDQWNSIYAYQTKYAIRLVHLDVAPSADFGVSLVASCCDIGVDQNVTIIASVQSEKFPTAGLRTANLSTSQLSHYGGAIIQANASTTTAFINFQPNNVMHNTTVAGVINHFQDGREQMAFFIESGNWSLTTTYLHHMWIQWGYRGLYQGYRRVHLQPQVDDLFLKTQMYDTGLIFRLRSEDIYEHVQWTYDINRRLNNGSIFFLEFGFNANGNLIYDYDNGQNFTQLMCQQPVFTGWNEPTNLEYKKPLGAGGNVWPDNPEFDWTAQCTFFDPLTAFFANITNRDAFGLVSHTFTHLELNNATYHDTLREIKYNLQYAELLNFTKSPRFSGGGLIPPAITGLHNGDAIRAFADNGLWNAIGDNTRPPLRNNISYFWPLMTTMEANGYDGYQITPRFATRIYYDCDQVLCNVKEWIKIGDGSPNDTIYTILELERVDATNQILSLYHDPYMFHQPNLRQADVEPVFVNGKIQKLSLIQMWTETISAELMRLITWPIITIKHDHVALMFNRRMILDLCKPYIQYTTSSVSTSSNLTQRITGFTVMAATGNYCEVPIPVTIPGSLVDNKGMVVEQIGTDPATIWVTLDGTPQSFSLISGITL